MPVLLLVASIYSASRSLDGSQVVFLDRTAHSRAEQPVVPSLGGGVLPDRIRATGLLVTTLMPRSFVVSVDFSFVHPLFIHSSESNGPPARAASSLGSDRLLDSPLTLRDLARCATVPFVTGRTLGLSPSLSPAPGAVIHWN